MLSFSVSRWCAPSDGPVLSRVTIAILGAILCGMGTGRWITEEMASLCGSSGLLAFACYLALEYVAWQRRHNWSQTQSRSAEHRLAVHVEHHATRADAPAVKRRPRAVLTA
jgi:hypothetical protein